jgi:murein DD-endopeptidase MepM/ murein hydrolase activator NlpD
MPQQPASHLLYNVIALHLFTCFKSYQQPKPSSMKEKLLLCAALGILIFSSCRKGAIDRKSKEQHQQETTDAATTNAVATTGPATISVYPVRGLHNTGYDNSLDGGSTASWNCNRGYSNSDFVAGDHLGIDIWAARNTPVAATVSGTIVLTGWSDYSGNKVTVRTSTGWSHFFCHLQSIAPGIVNGVTVTAGQIIGYVGNTGTASNGVVHLHYSLYPDGNYNAGINPWSLLYAVELNVCGTTTTVLDNFASGVGHFNLAPTYSGTTVGVATSSTATHYVSGSSTHLQVTLNDNTSVTTPWKVRLLSAAGTPANNISVGGGGKFHIWLKTSTAQSGATVQIYVDDSDGLEGSQALPIINDGQWHEYVWNLASFNGVNVSGGNGVINGPNVTLDAIILSQPNTGTSWTTFIDDVEWTSN